jgi:hypothetical protein
VHALRELIDSGLLTTTEGGGKPLRPTETATPTTRLLDDDATVESKLTVQAFSRFFASCAEASIRLRRDQLEYTVNTILRLKAHRLTDTLDLAKAREVSALFFRLRYFYPRNYLCLYDSLALILFLARYDLFPSWIFGVRLEPWEAHCWVQHESVVFNDGPEEVSDFTPVMCV